MHRRSTQIETFGERLTATFAARGHLCVGIDPHPYLLGEWGLADTADGSRSFGLRVVDAAANRVGIVKPQVAFFERYGAAGFAALEAVLAAAREADLLVLADGKRGDLGSSVEAYGEAWLTPGSPLEADAVTLSAYQGVGSLEAPLALAARSGKGVFVLAATSNPESFATQTAIHRNGEFAGRSVAGAIVAELSRRNPAPLGYAGVVIGATVRLADYGIAEDELASTPILGPGFGHQGVTFGEIADVYGTAARNVIVSSSRGILQAGKSGITAAIDDSVAALTEAMAA